MKKIILYNNSNNNHNNDNNIDKTDISNNIRKKTSDIIKKLNITENNDIFDIKNQIILINKLFIDENFIEKNILIQEIKNKINSYKQQDIKKNSYESENLITFDNVIQKLVECKVKCYYCSKNLSILYKKTRDNNQWTLDRINNYDEHSNDNTIICCLQCNLQRRRKNSEKFKFSKQLENKQIIIKKNI